MLVPGSVFSRLSAPLSRLVGDFFVVRQKTAARRAGYYLVSVITYGAKVAETAALSAVHGRSERLRSVLYEKRAVFFTNLFDNVNFSGETVKFRVNHKFYVGIKRKRFFKRRGIHIPGFGFGVYEYRLTSFIKDRIHGRSESHIRAENAATLQSTVSDFRSAIELFPGKLDAKMQSRRAARKTHGILHSYLFRRNSFDLVYILTDRRHPVSLERIGYELQFFPVHSR